MSSDPPPTKRPTYTNWDVPLDAEGPSQLYTALVGTLQEWLDKETVDKIMNMWDQFQINYGVEGKTMSDIVPKFDKVLEYEKVSLEVRYEVQFAFDQIVVFGDMRSAEEKPSSLPAEKGNATTTPKALGLLGRSSFLILFKHQGAYL